MHAIKRPHLTAIAALFRKDIMHFSLKTVLTDPYSSSLFVTDNEEGICILTANLAFYRNHFGDSPIYEHL
jgi:hypothetical protein